MDTSPSESFVLDYSQITKAKERLTRRSRPPVSRKYNYTHAKRRVKCVQSGRAVLPIDGTAKGNWVCHGIPKPAITSRRRLCAVGLGSKGFRAMKIIEQAEFAGI